MYLGQLSKLREVFASSRVTVALDDRDQAALLDREGDKEAVEAKDSVVLQDVQLHHQVRMLLILFCETTGSSSISDTLADSR